MTPAEYRAHCDALGWDCGWIRAFYPEMSRRNASRFYSGRYEITPEFGAWLAQVFALARARPVIKARHPEGV